MLAAFAFIAWVLFAPFAGGALIARWPLLQRLIGRFYVVCLSAGWLGLGLLFASVQLLDGAWGVAAALAGGTLAGLAFWVRGGGDDGLDDPAPEPPDPVPGETVDWEAFMRALASYSAARERARVSGSGPRAPTRAETPVAAGASSAPPRSA